MTVRLLTGDCRDVLQTLPSDHFDCALTSPPYWGLRSYLPDGHEDKHREIGLEPTLQAYLDMLVSVFREVRRVLKPEGTCWLNLGDSYASSGKSGTQSETANLSRHGSPVGLKPKDLCMVPNRLAIALQVDGWWVRSEIIWAKKNCMPESVTDRPTSSHEKIWLLTKSDRYWYDADAIAEPNITGQCRGGDINYRAGTEGNQRKDLGRTQADARETRNSRNVWTIASHPFKGAHFATFPPELAERCIKAGCPPGGLVLDPFAGAGTTGLVADRLGRNATLIDLSYREMATNRIRDDAPLFVEFGA